MCECVRASRGARGLGSGLTPVISQEPRAGAAHREPPESLSAVRRGSGQWARCQRGEWPESSDVVGGSAGNAAGFSGIREMAAFVSF